MCRQKRGEATDRAAFVAWPSTQIHPNQCCLSRSGHCSAAPVKVLVQDIRKQDPHCCFLSLSLQCLVLSWEGSEQVL